MNLPIEFEEKMQDLLGGEYNDYLKCYEEPRHYGLRVNTSKISIDRFLEIAPWPLRPIPWIENGFYYDGEKYQPAKHPYYFAGLYYLQEPSAMTLRYYTIIFHQMSTLFLKKFLFLNFLIFKVNVRVKSSFYVHFRKSVFH